MPHYTLKKNYKTHISTATLKNHYYFTFYGNVHRTSRLYKVSSIIVYCSIISSAISDSEKQSLFEPHYRLHIHFTEEKTHDQEDLKLEQITLAKSICRGNFCADGRWSASILHTVDFERNQWRLRSLTTLTSLNCRLPFFRIC